MKSICIKLTFDILHGFCSLSSSAEMCSNRGFLLYGFWRILLGIFLEDFSGHVFCPKNEEKHSGDCIREQIRMLRNRNSRKHLPKKTDPKLCERRTLGINFLSFMNILPLELCSREFLVSAVAFLLTIYMSVKSESVKCRFSKCRFSAELEKLENIFKMGGSVEK